MATEQSSSVSEEPFKWYNPQNANTTSHVLDERRRLALAEVDNAKFSWFHVKVCFTAGVGFFTDAYDIFAISIAAVMLGYVYGTVHTVDPNVSVPENCMLFFTNPSGLSTNFSVNAANFSIHIMNSSSLPITNFSFPITNCSVPFIGSLSSNAGLGIKVATPVGTLIGQLLFGWLADIVGRKKMYGFELLIIIFTTFAQALTATGRSVNIIGVLVVWRTLMGIGIGGDYPLSAVISSEFASTRSRGRLMTAVFAFQGWGQLAAAVVACVTVAAYKDEISQDDVSSSLDAIDKCWRILIGMGCIPGVIALYFRLTIPETPRFTMDIERNIQQASKDIEAILALKEEDDIPLGSKTDVPAGSWSDFIKHFGQRKYMKVLIGTSWSWFVLDIAFYGLGLNSSTILNVMHFGSGSGEGNPGIYSALINISIGNLVLSLAGLIPGYWVSFFLIDSWGRKPIQFYGFIVLTVLFLIMGFGFDMLNANDVGKKGFVFLYCLTDFFQNFGPNVTTFVIPGEVFPTRYRSTAHGISAASGKLGAILAQVAFSKINNLRITLEIFAFFMLTGILSTLLLPETKGRSLEELNEEE